jgi:hypothetical protein
MPSTQVFAKALSVAAALLATTGAAEGECKCCYSDFDDCDSSKKWCSKSAEVCTDCGGKFHCVTESAAAQPKAAQADADSHSKALAKDTTLLSEVVPVPEPLELASEKASAVSGKCCYRGPKDCDSERDWCSHDEGRCGQCQGSFFNVTALALMEDTTLLTEVAPVPVVLASGLPGKCCYRGPKDCDSERDWCSRDEGRCGLCKGSFFNASELAQIVDTLLLSEVASTGSKCCYRGPKDCDSARDWCSKDASRCQRCTGMFYDSNTTALLEDTTLLSEEPVVLAGKCCYSGPKDCDSERDWCSKDAARCDKCTGTFFNASELLAATTLLAEVAPEPLKLAAEGSGKCCYTGSTDCDSPSDYCSKSQSHCLTCGGNFHADLAEADTKPNAKATGDNATTLLSEVAPEPLMLAAELSADHAAWCEHERVDEKHCAAWIADQVARHKARRSDEATRRELRQADEATRREARRADKEARKDRANTTALAETADGGDLLLLAAAPGSQTPHSESQQPQRAPTAGETLKQHREQPQYGEQPEQPEQPKQPQRQRQ